MVKISSSLELQSVSRVCFDFFIFLFTLTCSFFCSFLFVCDYSNVSKLIKNTIVFNTPSISLIIQLCVHLFCSTRERDGERSSYRHAFMLSFLLEANSKTNEIDSLTNTACRCYWIWKEQYLCWLVFLLYIYWTISSQQRDKIVIC